MSIRKLLRVRSVAALSAVAATVLLLTGCVGGAATAPGDAGTTTLHLVGFAVPKEANNAIQKKFAETPEGKGVVWEESYGASGDQSRAVVNGLKADYVNFSLEGDVTRLVKAGLVDELEVRTHQGHRLGFGRRHCGAEGKSAWHQGLVGPGQAGCQDRHAQPGVVRFGALEHPGGLSAGDRQRRHRS